MISLFAFKFLIQRDSVDPHLPNKWIAVYGVLIDAAILQIIAVPSPDVFVVKIAVFLVFSDMLIPPLRKMAP